MRFIPATVDTLNLSLTNANDAFISFLPDSITSLNLAWLLALSDSILPKLPPFLVTLSLQGCIQLNRLFLDMMPVTLENLDLQECQGLGDNSFAAFRMTNLRTLNLSQCIRLTDAGLGALPSTLTSLTIEMCPRVGDPTLQALPNGLLELHAAECERISDTGLKALPRGLQLLDISHCSLITDMGIRYLPPDLKTLNLRGCASVTERGIEDLPPYLRDLDISSYQLVSRRWCGVRISNSDLSYLPESLTALNISGCPGITGMGLRHLRCDLRTLVANDISFLDVYFQLLPKSLTNLEISNCELTLSGLEHLSVVANIEVLKLLGGSIKLFEVPSLRIFPRLREIHVPTSGAADLSMLQKFPKHIDIYHQGIKLGRDSMN